MRLRKYRRLWPKFLQTWKVPRRKFEDSSQLTNWILESGVTCHMTPDILNFVPGSLVKMDKYIEVADGHLVKKKRG